MAPLRAPETSKTLGPYLRKIYKNLLSKEEEEMIEGHLKVYVVTQCVIYKTMNSHLCLLICCSWVVTGLLLGCSVCSWVVNGLFCLFLGCY